MKHFIRLNARFNRKIAAVSNSGSVASARRVWEKSLAAIPFSLPSGWTTSPDRGTASPDRSACRDALLASVAASYARIADLSLKIDFLVDSGKDDKKLRQGIWALNDLVKLIDADINRRFPDDSEVRYADIARTVKPYLERGSFHSEGYSKLKCMEYWAEQILAADPAHRATIDLLAEIRGYLARYKDEYASYEKEREKWLDQEEAQARSLTQRADGSTLN